MPPRLFLVAVLILMVFGGYPYAGLFVNHAMGTNEAVLTYADGTRRSLISGPDAPRPDWVPLLPGAVVSNASHWVPSKGLEVAGGLDLVTHSNVDEIKRFYLETLAAKGFEIRDLGLNNLNKATAQYLGIENTLFGHRNAWTAAHV